MFGRKYQAFEQIGRGKFGAVFRGNNIKTGELVAIKVDTNPDLNILKHEITILNYLYKSGVITIPIVYWYGLHETGGYAAVIPLYEYSLTQIFSNTPLPNSLREKNVGKIDEIMGALVDGLAAIHKAGIIHRDIKPDNIMYKEGEFHFIDFGFATSVTKTFRDGNTTIIGSPKYASIHIHLGIEPAERDDLISLGYVYLFMALGELEWISNMGPNPNYNESNNLLSPRLLEIAEAKSWENISVMAKPFEKIYRYLDICYQFEFGETMGLL